MPPIMDSSDFTIRRRDFPALPGNEGATESSSESSWSEESSGETVAQNDPQVDEDDHPVSTGVKTSTEDRVSNIPCGVVQDQFGMLGLLTFIRAVEAKPSLASLTLGEDLADFGMNLESTDNLYPEFDGPWPEPCGSEETGHGVNKDYAFNNSARKRLAKIELSKYEDDLLFYLFYTQARDRLQVIAASELFQRGWRYHTEQRIWMASCPGCTSLEMISKYESGNFYVFDVQDWRKVTRHCFVDKYKLENKPEVQREFNTFNWRSG